MPSEPGGALAAGYLDTYISFKESILHAISGSRSSSLIEFNMIINDLSFVIKPP